MSGKRSLRNHVYVCDSTHEECSAPGGIGCGYCIGVPCKWPRRELHHEPPLTMPFDDDEGVGAEDGE